MTGDIDTDAPTDASTNRRLHPLSVLFDISRWLPQALLPIVVLMITQRDARALPIMLLAVAPIVLVIAGLSVVRHLRFTYRYDASELVVRSGLFTRNERSIPYVRIQNLDASQNLVQRLFGVAVVHIQTGGGTEPEASLRVVPIAALHEMRARVMAAGGRPGTAMAVEAPTESNAPARVTTPEATSPDPGVHVVADTSGRTAAAAGAAPDSRVLLSLSPGDLLLAGFIENRGMVLIAGALALLEQAGVLTQFTERLFSGATVGIAGRWLGSFDLPVVSGAVYLAALLLGALLFIRLLSTVWAVVRLYDFRLTRIGDELHTEYGLFTRVNATIPLRRVQTVIVRDRMLHRVLGRRTVIIETAGGGGAETRGRSREPIAPILRVDQLPALLDELHPGLVLERIALQPVHPRAFARIVRGSLLLPLAISGVAFIFVQAWALAILTVLLAVAIVHARLRVRHLGWSLTDDAIVVRNGALTRATRIARFNRVQVVAVDRNPFDIRTGMARVRADTAGAGRGVVIPFLAERTARDLRDELAARTVATAFTW